jgi:hypothetical protein
MITGIMRNRSRRSNEGQRGAAVVASAFLTLIAFVGALRINQTFHPSGGNILPAVVLGIGLLAMIGSALE